MSNQSNTSRDPNLEPIRRERRDLLNRVGRRSPVDRISFITSMVSGRRTLDIGCVEHDPSYQTQSDWLHAHVAKAASYCLGLDILEADVASLSARGYHVRCHDITRSPIAETFDVVICGEIAEHIGNVDGLLTNCRECLNPGGQLILTTPYPWFLGMTLRHTMAGLYFPGSVDHVAWYDPSQIAELATRHGYDLEAFAGVIPLPQSGGPARRVFEAVMLAARKGWLPFLSRLVGCRSVLYVLKTS